MSNFAVAWNRTKLTATVQPADDILPLGSTLLGTFHHDDGSDPNGWSGNHVVYHHIRDLLRTVSWHAMAYVNIVDDRPTAKDGLWDSPDPDRYMFFATRANMPSNTQTITAGTEYRLCKTVFNTPEYPVNDFVFNFSNYASTEGGNSPQETLNPTGTLIIVSAKLKVGSRFYPLKFASAAGVTIAINGSTRSDALVLPRSLKPNTSFEIWVTTQGTVGQTMAGLYRLQRHRGERIWASATLTDLDKYYTAPSTASIAVLDADRSGSAGAYAAVYGSTAQPMHYGPDMMWSKGWDGRPVPLITGDSLGEGRQEFTASADERGNRGWIKKWLDAPTGIGRIPFFFIGVAGAGSVRELTGSGSTIATRRWDALDSFITNVNGGKRPFTLILNQMGQNDTNATYATAFTYYSGLVARLRARYAGVKIIAVPPFGRTSSSNQWKDTAGQTFAAQDSYPADATNASGKWRLRQDIMAKTNTCCDDYIDTFAAWSDPVALGKWRPLTWTGTLVDALTATPWDRVRITCDTPPKLEDVVSLGTGAGIIVREIVNNRDGTYTLIDYAQRTTVVAAGTQCWLRPTNDGVHPSPSAVDEIWPRLDPSEKVKLLVGS